MIMHADDVHDVHERDDHPYLPVSFSSSQQSSQPAGHEAISLGVFLRVEARDLRACIIEMAACGW